MKNSLKFAFLEFVNQRRLIEKKLHILVAVSGGMDSMVLLHLLLTWRDYFESTLSVAHFNHQLRGKISDKDEAFVQAFCQKNDLDFFVGRGDVAAIAREKKISQEAAGRMLRENFLQQVFVKQNCDVIVTAHHLDDQVETMLMRLLAGAGLEGIAGIRLRRENIVRPLLFAKKTTIKQYAATNNIIYREDESNQDLRYRRNKIRHALIPYLEKEFQFYQPTSFLNLSLIIQEWLPYQEKLARDCLDNDELTGSENKIRLDMEIYKGYFSGIQVKILELALVRLKNERVKLTTKQYQGFMKWVTSTDNGSVYEVWPNIIVRKKKRWLIFEKVEALPGKDA